MSAVTSSKLDPVVYREGMLYKRQRGLKQGNAKKLKFQERFCRLTCTSLDYYDPNPKKRVSESASQLPAGHGNPINQACMVRMLS